MATAPDGELTSVSLVLTKDQVRRLGEIHKARRTPVNRVSKSDIAREVVEVGLASYSLATDTDNTASDSKRSAA
ncbi:MAG: hypothetical protein WBA46_19460 [Thermomicrobiales bacterium]